MVEDRSFSINRYVSITEDWARVPDGRYFSNKPPGPALYGSPLYWAIDRLRRGSLASREERDDQRLRGYNLDLQVLSIALQVFPFSFLVFLILGRLKEKGVSDAALHLAALGLLFGNTAALLMNLYFGHPMAATFVLGMVAAALHRSPAWMGFFGASALLTDYGAGFVLLGSVFLLPFFDGPLSTRVKRIVLGAALPAFLWCLYHVRCYGSVFGLPMGYENPAFVEVRSRSFDLWGLFSYPDPVVFFRLLFGSSRGLIWTQPWVLFLLVFAGFRLWRTRAESPLDRSSFRPLFFFLRVVAGAALDDERLLQRLAGR